MQTRAEHHVSLQTYVLQNEMLFTDLMPFFTRSLLLLNGTETAALV